MSGGIAASPRRENLAYRLDATNGTTNTLATEISTMSNKIREALMGCPPPAIAKDKEAAERAAPIPGFLGSMIARSEDNNRILNYVLGELQTVLGEISQGGT
jgi:hypothetical protein